MAGNDTRQLQLQISASAELMIRNLRQADAAVGQFQASTNGRLASIDARFAALGKLKSGLASFGVGDLAAAATGASLVALAKRGLDYASSLGEVAQQLGFTTRELQLYRYAASQAGVEQEELDKGLQKLTGTIGKAKLGAEGPIKAFNALGISVRQLEESSNGQIFELVAEGLAKIPDRAKRGAIELALFGRAGQQLDTILSGGRGAIDELSQAAERLGLVLSDEQIQRADDTADKLSAVKQVLEANIAGVIADNSAAILGLANALARAAAASIKFASEYPQATGLLAGAAIGGRIAGVPGAAVGGAIGLAVGNNAGRKSANENMDVAFRRQAYFEARVRSRTLENQRQGKSGAGQFGGGDAGWAIRIRQVNPSVETSNTLPEARNEEERQRRLFIAAMRAAQRPNAKPIAPAADGADVPDFLASGGKKGGGRKGPSAEQLARQAEAEARRDRAAQSRAADMATRISMDVASGRADLSLDPDARLKIELERIELARQARDRDLDEQALDNRYIAANLQSLKLMSGQVETLDKQLAARKHAQEGDATAAARAQAAADDEIALLELSSRLTDIASERRRIEERILLLKQAEERKQLERVANDRTGRYDAGDRQLASDQLARLPARQEAERVAQRRENAGPLSQYFRQLSSEAGDLQSALEGVAVRGLGGIEDEAAGTIASLIKVKGAFGGLVNSVLADLARLTIRQGLLSLLGSIGGKGRPSAPSVGDIAGLLSKGYGGANTPGFAVGGSLLIGGNGGVDRNVLSLNGMPIARVSRGERLDISTGNPAAATIGSLGGRSAAGAGGMVALQVTLSGDLDARIDNRAAGVAVTVLKAGAPEIVQAAAETTMASLLRPTM